MSFRSVNHLLAAGIVLWYVRHRSCLPEKIFSPETPMVIDLESGKWRIRALKFDTEFIKH